MKRKIVLTLSIFLASYFLLYIVLNASRQKEKLTITINGGEKGRFDLDVEAPKWFIINKKWSFLSHIYPFYDKKKHLNEALGRAFREVDEE